MLASPGMIQSGLSRELFENWCTDKRNGVIIAGYCVEGTLAKQILSQPAEVPTMSGQMLPLKCSVEYISFSAHTDYQQTSEFIRELKPNHVVSDFVFTMREFHFVVLYLKCSTFYALSVLVHAIISNPK